MTHTPTHTSNHQHFITQSLRFILVGISAAFTHFISLILLVNVFQYPPLWANFFAFIIAFIISFLGHFFITFANWSHTSKSHTPKYSSFFHKLSKWLISSIATFSLNQLLFTLSLALFGNSHYIVIWLIITAVVTTISFILGKLWAFKT